MGQGRFQDSASAKTLILLLGVGAPLSPVCPSVPSPKTSCLPLARMWAAPSHREQGEGSGTLTPNPSLPPFTPSCRGTDAASPCAFRGAELVGSWLASLLPYDSDPLVLLSQSLLIHLLSSFPNVAHLPSCSPRLDGFLSLCFVVCFLTSLLSFGEILTGVESDGSIQSTFLIQPWGINWELPSGKN